MWRPLLRTLLFFMLEDMEGDALLVEVDCGNGDELAESARRRCTEFELNMCDALVEALVIDAS